MKTSLSISLFILLFYYQNLSAQNVERGDALAIYGDALHTDPTTGPFLGATRGERETSSGSGTYDLSGWDDGDGTNDEDAFSNNYSLLTGTAYSVFLPNIDGSLSSYSITCAVGGPNAPVSAWIDFDGDAVFELTEMAAAISSGGSVTLIWTLPINLVPTLTYARIRVATIAAQITLPTGTAADGEVEDYIVRILKTFSPPSGYKNLLDLNPSNGVSGIANTISAVNSLSIGGGITTTMILSGTMPNTIAINDAHVAGLVGIRTGHNSGVATTEATALVASYKFSSLLPDFSFRLLDIDVGDHLKVKAFNNGTPVAYVFNRLTGNNYYNYDVANQVFYCKNDVDSGVDPIAPSSADLGVQVYCQAPIDSISIAYWDLTGSGTYTITDISSYTQDPLPVSLLYFLAEKQTGSEVTLKWETAQDNEVESYVLQRSTDGNIFTSIADILSLKQHSNISYLYTDKSLAGSLVYYRLKIIETSNEITFSKTIVVRSYKSDAIRILNASLTGEYKAIIESNANLTADLLLINSSGVILHRQKISLQTGINHVTLLVNTSLPAGAYILQINTGDKVVSKKIVQ